MILETEILVKISTNTYNHWLNKGYSIPSHVDCKRRTRLFRRGMVLKVKVSDLPPQSNVVITARCVTCGNHRRLQYHHYTPMCNTCTLRGRRGVNSPRYSSQVSLALDPKERQFEGYLKRKYHITLAEYYALFEQQEHGCAICKTHQSVEGRKFAVDHCHATGKVRGLLCQPCNTAIGLLKEQTDVMLNAIAYLEKRNK